MSRTTKCITAKDTIPIRHAVLRPHQTPEDCVYPGDHVDEAFHFGAFEGDELVTIASVYPEVETRYGEVGDREQYRLRGMATLPEWRGSGLGKDVLRACVQRCWDDGGQVFWCNARTSAAGFYEGMGFMALPEEFDIPGIGPHRVMYVVNRA